MEPRLTDLRIDLTSYCNEACVFCPFHGFDEEIKKGQFIDGDYFIKVAQDLNHQGFNINTRFVGSGEPTLHPDFIRILKSFKENNHRIKLITNGQQTKKHLVELSELLDSLIVSVHGTEQTHDYLTRKKGSYKKAIEGIRLIREDNAEMNILMHFVITPDNYREMYAHAENSVSIGAKPRYQHLVMTKGNMNLGTFDLDGIAKEIARVKQDFPETNIVPEVPFKDFETYYDGNQHYLRKPHACSRILTDLNIRYDGKVIMCDNRIFGDITSECIVDIIQSDKRIDFIKERLAKAKKERLPNSCSRCCYN
ncbi:MAG: radical SAM protein [Candidatus Woesearchaeota archaeon]